MRTDAGASPGARPNVPRLGYVPALDGLRGVAIALVITFHYGAMPGAGAIGVGLFFVLSGFLITTLLLEELDETGKIRLRRFYARRARRLLPSLAVVVGAYLAVRGEAALKVAAFAAFYVANIVQAFWRANPVAGSALAHLWSLAEEEQFYLLWPLMLLVLMKARRITTWLVVLVVALVTYRAVLALHGANVLRLYYSPDTHSDWLAAGALLAVLRRRGLTMPEPLVVAAAGLTFFGALVSSATIRWAIWEEPLFMLGCVVLVASAYAESPFSEILSRRPAVWLGQISYSLYLWHIPVFAALGYKPALAPVALVLALPLSWLSYRFVEQPFRRPRGPRTLRSQPETAPIRATP